MKWRYVIAANALVVLCGIALVTGLSFIWLLAALLIMGIVLGALYMIDKSNAKKGASGIESSLFKQSDAFSKNVRPDQVGEIDDMRGQFMKELGALKGSKLGGGGSQALYSLPWYMIIGPPGAGKSTALRNSGLQFPSRRGAIKGIGGTRNCDWWLTNQAVILDTAGRYATEDEDREEWLAFLDTLKKNRKKKPINGLIVAVSITDLGGHNEEEVEELGKRIRERLDEVDERLELQVPVYLMITKLDLVPGFMETFGTLKKNERGQIWGSTFALDQGGTPPKQVFSEHFERWYDTLQNRMYMRLEEERRPESRERIYQFPQQLDAARPQLEQFVETVFAPDVYREPPLMRGVYFSSGTQEGRPIDMLTSSMAEAFGVKPRDEAEPTVEAKSYFLGDLFAKVMFPDEDIAARNKKGKKVYLVQRASIAGAAALSALLITILPISAFRENAKIVQSTQDIITHVADERARDSQTVVPPKELATLRERLRALKDWEAGAPPLAMRFGMFQGGTLFPLVRRYYVQTLQKELLEPILKGDVDEMKQLKQVYGFNSRPSDQEFKRFFDKLKLHLLLTAPHQALEPPLQDEEEKWVIAAVTKRWSAAMGDAAADEKVQAEMGEHVRFYIELLRDNPEMAIARDELAVRETRNMLNRVSYPEAVVKEIIAETSTQDRDQNIRRLMGGEVTPLVADRNIQVRAAFTKWGWETAVRDRIEQEAEHSDRWVFEANPKTAVDSKRFIAELRSVYFKEYIREWRAFVDALRMTQPTDVADALRMLVELTRGESPAIKKLMQAVGENTALKEKGEGALGAVAKVGGGIMAKIKNTFGADATAAVSGQATKKLRGGYDDLTDAQDVEMAFKDFVRMGYVPADVSDKPKQLPIDSYQEQLVVLRDAVKSYVEDAKDAGPMLQKIQGSRTTIAGMLSQMDVNPAWRPRLESLLLAPLDDLVTSLVAIKAEIGRKWCSAVVTPYYNTLRNRFPFSSATDEAAIADVTAYLAPKTGLLWAFYASDLATDVLQSGTRFYFDNRMMGMAARAYEAHLVPYLQNAYGAASALFPAGSPSPKMEFDVRITPSASFSRIALEVGGQTVEYGGGPVLQKRVVWPGSDAQAGATIRLTGRGGAEDTIQKSGEWGLFRLFEQAHAVKKGDRYLLKWKSEKFHDDVTIEFRVIGSRANSFAVHGSSMRLQVGDLTPPVTIAHGSPPCNP